MGLFSNMFSPTSGISHGANGAMPVAPPANPFGNGSPANGDGGIPAAAGLPGTPGATGNEGATGGDGGSSVAKIPNIFDTILDAQGKPVVPAADPTAKDIFNFDPVKTVESARKLDFTQGLDATLVEKALGGGQDAASSLIALINHAAANAFAAATVSTGKFINQGISENNARFKEILPRQIKQVQLGQEKSTNPIFDDPAVAPLVDSLRKMAFSNNPNAEPSDVNATIEQYLTSLGLAVAGATPQAKAAKATAAAGEQDWSLFLAGQ